MEISEGKTKEIHATTTNSSSSQCSYASLIPFELMREILIRLPAKSLLRFRCVSRQWASVTTDQEFTNSFTTHSSSVQRSCLLLNFQENYKNLYFSIPQRKDLEMCLSSVEEYNITPQKEDMYMYTPHQYQSIHGLVSFEYKYDIVIWNPTMREYITFRKPYQSDGNTQSYLGYDPIGNTYKLLSMLYGSTDEPHVLTLGAKESSWRKIKSIPTPYLPYHGICIDGVLFYKFKENSRKEVMSFNVRTEIFNFIPTYSHMQHDDSMFELPLLSYKGRLAWVFLESSSYKVWVLEDANTARWSCKDFDVPLSLERHPSTAYNLRGVTYLRGVTNDGEFIYLSIPSRSKVVHVSYYDPESKSNRRIKIEISEDDGFWFCKYLKGILSDHIENIMPVNRLTCLPSVSLVRVP